MSRFALALILFVVSLAPVLAQTPSVVVEKAWARATPGESRTGGVFMTLVEKGTAPDKLVRAATPLAGKVELHTSTTEDGIMKMRPVTAITVEPGKPTELKPGGYHVMLMDLKQPLKEGDSFPLTLSFEKAGEVAVTVKVEKAGAMTPGHMTGHGKM